MTQQENNSNKEVSQKITSYSGLRSNGQELCENSRPSKQSVRQSGCFFLATFPELSPLPALG